MKNTSSPLITNDSFFLDLIKGFSVSKLQSSKPSFVEKHLIVFSKSTTKNLINYIEKFINNINITDFIVEDILNKTIKDIENANIH